MINRDAAFVERRRTFYENQYRVSEPIDPWHDYAQTVLHTTTRRWHKYYCQSAGQRLLNAGSGGSDYGIPDPMTHLDIFASRVAQHPGHLVGDIAAIPVADESFDSIICIGSVLNYADPLLAIREMSRVLRTGGKMILEYERSGSFEYRLKYGLRAKACARVATFYGGVSTEIWSYGDEFVDGLLAASSFAIRKDFRFHGISAVGLAFTKSLHFATRLTVADRWLAQLWPIRTVASNRLILIEKLPC